MEEKEISWKVLDIPVYGTVLFQKSDGVKPGVILVAGSGPTDRNWCSPLLPGTNCSGKLIAEKLAESGFVTMRYDKLASGPHVMENLPKFAGKLSMQSHLQELSGAVEALSMEENVDPDRLFVLTNSEGAIHAVNYQLNPDVPKFKGLLLTGPPGRSVGDVVRDQLAVQIASMPESQEILEKYDKAIWEFLSGNPIVLDPLFQGPVKQLLQSLDAPANMPFSRELWAYRLSDYIGGIGVPIMVLIGKKDVQVNWKIDGSILEKALNQHKSASFVYPEFANHVLKHEELPPDRLTAEYVGPHYNAADTLIDEKAMDSILSWLNRLV